MDWRVWLKGLASAIIGGVANAVVVANIAPESFNMHSGMDKLVTIACFSAVLSAATYLKQSPLP